MASLFFYDYLPSSEDLDISWVGQNFYYWTSKFYLSSGLDYMLLSYLSPWVKLRLLSFYCSPERSFIIQRLLSLKQLNDTILYSWFKRRWKVLCDLDSCDNSCFWIMMPGGSFWRLNTNISCMALYSILNVELKSCVAQAKTKLSVLSIKASWFTLSKSDLTCKDEQFTTRAAHYITSASHSSGVLHNRTLAETQPK